LLPEYSKWISGRVFPTCACVCEHRLLIGWCESCYQRLINNSGASFQAFVVHRLSVLCVCSNRSVLADSVWCLGVLQSQESVYHLHCTLTVWWQQSASEFPSCIMKEVWSVGCLWCLYWNIIVTFLLLQTLAHKPNMF